jgi:hypothetical protein
VKRNSLIESKTSNDKALKGLKENVIWKTLKSKQRATEAQNFTGKADQRNKEHQIRRIISKLD